METVFLDKQTLLAEPCVATIGFFDGVHQGHQYLIKNVVEQAHRQGIASVVVTFDKHPKAVLQPNNVPELLTTTEQKIQLLSQTGIDKVIVLHFTHNLAALTAQAFITRILHKQLHVQTLMIGYDNKFGHNRTEGFVDYVNYGKAVGMRVIENKVLTMGGEAVNISSSVIRKLLKKGEITKARQYLGYPYTLTSQVVRGYQEGRKLGFPTANLDLHQLEQLIPAKGVYAVKVQIDGKGIWHQGMTSIGTRPTYQGKDLSIETNILGNFHEDIYQHQLSVAIYERIRNEICFESAEALSKQMRVDAVSVSNVFNK